MTCSSRAVFGNLITPFLHRSDLPVGMINSFLQVSGKDHLLLKNREHLIYGHPLFSTLPCVNFLICVFVDLFTNLLPELDSGPSHWPSPGAVKNLTASIFSRHSKSLWHQAQSLAHGTCSITICLIKMLHEIDAWSNNCSFPVEMGRIKVNDNFIYVAMSLWLGTILTIIFKSFWSKEKLQLYF